jgi:tetratricopeptide (TPR) repeat protein
MKKLILLGFIVLFIGCPSAPKNSAKIYIGQGDYERAKEQLIVAIKGDPSDFELYCLLGKTEIGLANWVAAEKAFDDAFSINSPQTLDWIHEDRDNIAVYWQAFYNAAFTHYQDRKFKEALKSLNYAQMIDPDNISQYILAGEIYRDMGDIEASNKAYKKARSIDPENPEVYYLIGKAQFETKSYDSSIVYLNDAVKYFQIKYDKIEKIIFQNIPEPDIALKHEINKLWKDKKNDELDQVIKVKLGFDGGISTHKRNIETFFKTTDGLAQSYYLIGMNHYKMNKNDLALENLKKSLEFMPEDFDALFFTGELMIRAQKYREAIGYFEKLTQLKPDDLYAWFYIGASYLQLKEFQKAIEVYEEQVLKLDPKFTEAWTNLASAYQATGNSKKAYECLMKADELKKGQQ